MQELPKIQASELVSSGLRSGRTQEVRGGSYCLVDSEPWALLIEAPESSSVRVELY